MREQVKNLWKRCFADDEAFIELYFARRYRDEANLVRLSPKGELMAALQLIPYPMTFGKGKIETSYISGACTDLPFRGRGEMRRLLTDTHRRMYADGVALATLIPAEKWLHGYYARAGYADAFLQRECTGTIDFSLHPDPTYRCSTERLLSDDAYAWLSELLCQRPFTIQHTAEDLSIVADDLHLSGGAFWVARRPDGQVAGVMSVTPRCTTLHIEELEAENKAVAYALLYQACLEMQYADVQRICPCNEAHPKGYHIGMARPIHPEVLLALWAEMHPEKSLHILLTDEDLPENDGHYTVQEGCLRRTSLSGKEYTSVTPASLTALLFEGHFPYMNMMMN